MDFVFSDQGLTVLASRKFGLEPIPVGGSLAAKSLKKHALSQVVRPTGYALSDAPRAPTAFDDSDPHLRHKDNTRIRAAVMQTDELVKRGQGAAATLTLLLIKPDQLNKKQVCDHVYRFPVQTSRRNPISLHRSF